jgi:hypothetical protein
LHSPSVLNTDGRLKNTGNCRIRAVEHDWRSPTDFKTLRIAPPPPPASNSTSPHDRERAARAPRPRPAEDADEDEEEEEEQGTGCDPRADPDLLRRATVYRRARFSLHVGGPAAPAPRAVAASAALRARVAAWARRELRALLPLVRARAAAAAAGGVASPRGSSSQGGRRRREGEGEEEGRRTGGARAAGIRDEWLVRFVVDVLAAVPVRSCEAVELLAPHLGGEALAQLFLHELASWMRSPCATVEAWDGWVRYPPRRMFSALDKG